MNYAELLDYLETRTVRVPFSGCWIWMGSSSKQGYGLAKLDGKLQGVHRFVVETLLGQKLGVKEARHTCDVPSCVNPAHLLVGTKQDNENDKKLRGRLAVGECAGGAKLTNAQAEAIRAEYIAGVKPAVIKAKYGISKSILSRVVRRITY